MSRHNSEIPSFHPHPWIHRMHQTNNQSSHQTIDQVITSSSRLPSRLFNLKHHNTQSSSQTNNQSSSNQIRYFAHMDEFEHDHGLPYEKAMIAGASAGVMEHLCMFPVDTVKTRMQAAPINPSARYLSFASTLGHVVREEGALRLYRGVNAAVLGAIPSHAANYAVYEYFKHQFGGNESGHHVFANAAAGAIATASHDAVITPLDVVKQRLQVAASPYSGVMDCIRSTLRNEGLIAFYASYPTTVLMNVPFMAVHFAGYESFKLLLTGTDRQHDHTVAEELIAGAGAGACAGLVSTPLDVVKTRIQTQLIGPGHPRLGAVDVARLIWKEAGVRGFTRGASARVLYFMPSSAICWSTYETVKRVLKEAW